jgi:hypothetical protein
MQPNYYIETSFGRLFFYSDDIMHLEINKNDNFKAGDSWYIYYNCIVLDADIFEQFMNSFDFRKIYAKDSKVNGIFLVIELDDPYYGAPEYKIYELGG